MAVKLGNGKWAVKENNLLAYNDNSGQFFNKEFDFTRGSSATYVGKDGLIKTAGLQDTNLVQNGDFSQLGSELVTNGDFATDSDWTKQTSWSISGGSANYDFLSDSKYIRQTLLNGGFVAGKTYKINFEITSGTAYMNVSSNASGLISINTYSVGSYSIYVTPSISASDLLFYGRNTNGTAFSIDNVSVKQVDPNDEWILGSGWSIGDSVANVNNISANHLSQDGIVSDNNTYAITFTILNYSSGSIRLRLGNTYGGYTSGNGTYTQYIQCAGSDKFRVYSSPSGATLSISNISVQEVQVNTPRIDFSDSADGALLLEPQSTNLLPYSEDLNQWSNNNSVTLTSGYLAPDGTLRATKVSGIIGSSSIYNTASSSETATRSIYARTVSGTGTARLMSYFGNTNNLFTLTEEWQRFELTGSVAAGGTNFYIDFRDNSQTLNEFIIWGGQSEELPYATSYIPTSGSASTRIAETCNNSGSAQDFNSEEGVLYAEISALVNSDTTNPNRGISISDGSVNNTILIYYQSALNKLSCILISNGATEFSHSTTLFDVDDYLKIALKYKQNDFALWVNGTEIATDTSGNAPIGLSELAFDNGSGNDNFYGKTKNVQVFTEALSDEELQKLTSI